MDLDASPSGIFSGPQDKATAALSTLVRVMLVDDHTSVLEGYEALISRQPDLKLVGMFTSGVDALARFSELWPDVVLIDIYMPALSGLETTRQLLAQHPESRVIILSQSTDPAAIAAAFAAGARGYLVKGTTFKQITSAIHKVVGGESVIDPIIQDTVIQEFQRLHQAVNSAQHNLTPHEQRILTLLAEGHTTKQIATVLNKADKTISNQITVIYQKLGVNSRSEAISYALRMDPALISG